MIKVSNEDIRKNHTLFLEAYKASSTAFLESSYIQKTFPILESAANRQYPYQVKLPKSIPELLQGDFSPSRILTINQPIQGIYSNMWFGDATSRCTLRCGYVDGNSSKLCQQTIGGEDIHMILGGATGQGKSVTLNSIIFGLCMEFAPWEIDLTLVDAKIVEFKSYALQHPMPHIRRIAATEDADYIISVLDTLKTEMSQWYSIFTLAGVKKIDDFRKKTGLMMPQHIIIVDEFQTMFKNAKKKLPKIIDILDAFGRLGRATGFHLIFASQELGSDLPKGLLANIKVRSAMGCDANISEMILGNDEAKNNKGKRGRLIINSEIEKGKEANTTIVVPFMPDNERLAIGQNIIAEAKKLDYHTGLSFYDAQASISETGYSTYLKSFKQTGNRFILGEPSFVKSGEQAVTLDFTGKDIENILVLTPAASNQQRYFTMLKENAKLLDKTQSLVISLSDVYTETCNAREIVSNNMFSDKKSFDNDVLNASFTLVARRKLCLAIDKLVFGSSTSKNHPNFYNEFEEGSVRDTELNRQRFAAGMYLLGTDTELIKSFGLDDIAGSADKERKCTKIVGAAVDTINIYGCVETMIEPKNMPPLFVWLLGMDKMIGLGRDPKMANLTKFKKNLQDCTDLNIRFIVFSNTLEDMSDLKTCFRWVITDGASPKDLQTLRLSDDYPDQVGSNLGVLSDTLAVDNKCVKFKKMRLEGEIFTD